MRPVTAPQRPASVIQPLVWPFLALLQFGWIIWPQLGLMLGLVNVAFILALAVVWMIRRLPVRKG
jgi:hypothetical protein